MRSFLLATMLIAPLLPATAVRADQFETFHLDPSRSSMQFLSGDFSTQITDSTFLYAPLTLQSGSDPAPLGGEFVLRIGNDAGAPSFFGIVSGSADVRPVDGSSVSPGPGGGDGMVDAALGLSFLDSALGVSGDVAIHDLVFSLEGFYDIYSNSLGPLGLQGDLGWLLAAGAIEIQTSAGPSGTAFAPFAVGGGYVERTLSQFSEIAPGVYEVVMPYQYTVYVSTDSGPFTNTNIQMTFGGEIVATNVVPEPGTGALLGLGLATLAAGRRREGGR